MSQIYLDHASTTPVRPEVVEAMTPYFTEHFGNPSSIYPLGQEASDAVAAARESLAGLIGATPREIFFTSGGTESDNWALKGFARANAAKGRHLITSAIEHHAVLHTCQALEREGFEVTYLPVDEHGLVSVEDFKAAIRPDTILASIMFANNEIGTMQPIKEIGALCREKKIPFHTDAVQAVGHVPINVKEMNIDMLSLSGHKFHSPKGVGALYVRRGIPLKNLIEGGQQEKGKRGGTENMPGIVGMAAALKESTDHMAENMKKITTLREKLITGLEKIPHSKLNGDRNLRVPGTVNFCFEGIEGESMLLLLDANGIAASSGSACTSGSLDPSHVLLALGLPHEVAHGSLRLSIGEYNNEAEIDHILETVPKVVERLRDMSPVWDELVKGERPHLI